MNAEQEALLRKAEESIRAAKTLVRDNFPDFAIARAYLCDVLSGAGAA